MQVSIRLLVSLWVMLAWPVGCGPSYPESQYPAQPPTEVAAPSDLVPPPPGSVWRRDVDAVLDAGLGRFLQRAELEAELEEGTFVGFRVTALLAAEFWQGVDLAVGDVVMQVNGMPIEQPEQAHAAFESLRDAERLTVSVRRGAERRELTYAIVDASSPASIPAQTPAP